MKFEKHKILQDLKWKQQKVFRILEVNHWESTRFIIPLREWGKLTSLMFFSRTNPKSSEIINKIVEIKGPQIELLFFCLKSDFISGILIICSFSY